MTGRQQWMLVAMGASTAAAALAERAVVTAWRLATDEEPPVDPAAPEIDWPSALAWTAASAVAVAVAQLAARRGAALAWRQLTGRRPPGPRRKGRKARQMRQVRQVVRR